MNNRQRGNAFEKELSQMLSDRNFWVHRLAQTAAGQPADLIAVKRGVNLLIDAKECTSHKFTRHRLEPNQYTAMKLWQELTGSEGLFAIRMHGEIFMLTLTAVREALRKHPVLYMSELRRYGTHFDEWVAQWN